MNKIESIKASAKNMRRKMLEMAYNSEYKSHYGGGLSEVEILAVLYKEILNIDPKNPEMPDRDRFFMSKGHGVLGLYTVLNEVGFISDDILKTFQKNGSVLGSLSVKNESLGIESSNGSLGHGVSMAIGSLLAGRLKSIKYKAYVLLGDGECNEGSVWEAAMLASQLKLNNLIVIIDNNGFQSDGSNEEILNMQSFKEKWSAFGWNAFEVDGHNVEELYNLLTNIPQNDMPTAIIAKTVKGKGISFMENNNLWHHDKLTDEQLYEQAIKEIEEGIL